MAKRTAEKNCYCFTCERQLHALGVMSHRAMHRRRKEDCKISFTDGHSTTWKYSRLKEQATQQ